MWRVFHHSWRIYVLGVDRTWLKASRKKHRAKHQPYLQKMLSEIQSHKWKALSDIHSSFPIFLFCWNCCITGWEADWSWQGGTQQYAREQRVLLWSVSNCHTTKIQSGHVHFLFQPFILFLPLALCAKAEDSSITAVLYEVNLGLFCVQFLNMRWWWSGSSFVSMWRSFRINCHGRQWGKLAEKSRKA